MIRNQKQCNTTKKRIAEFETARNLIESDKTMDTLLKTLQLKMLDSQIDDFRHELVEYKALIEKRVQQLDFCHFDELPEVLIKSRIANGLTQAQLGERLGIPEQQVQRNESCSYSSTNYLKLVEVAQILGVRLKCARVQIVDPVYKFSSEVAEKVALAHPKLESSKSLFAFQS
jgi:transcriptional regulator with XRE-family HTH domain